MTQRLTILAVLALSCTNPPIPKGGASIGPEGGAVASADGRLTLTIPAGALATQTQITVTAVPPADWAAEVTASGPLSEVYELQPEGTVFATPATLDWTIDPVPAALRDGVGQFMPVGLSRSAEGVIERHLETHSTLENGLAARTTISHLSGHWLATSRDGVPVARLIESITTGTYEVGAPVALGGLSADQLASDVEALEFAVHLLSDGPLEFDQLPVGWTTTGMSAVVRTTALAGGTVQVDTPTVRCNRVGEGYLRVELAVNHGSREESFTESWAKLRCIQAAQWVGVAEEVTFPKVDSVVPGRAKVSADGKFFAAMRTGIGSVTVLDPADPGTVPQLTFTDAANPVELVAAQPRPDGSMVLLGSRRFGRPFAALMDMSDTMVWSTAFGERSTDYSTDIADLGGGEYALAFGAQYGNGKLQIARLDMMGAVPTIVTLGGAMKGLASAVAPRQGGGYFVAGVYESSTTTQDAVLVALSATDAIAWQKNFATAGRRLQNPRPTPLADGGVLFTAMVYDAQTVTWELFLARFDAAGALAWQRTYGTAISLGGATQSGDGFLLAVSTAQDLAIVQLAGDGTVVRARTFNDSGSTSPENATAIATTAAGGVALLGYRHLNTTWHLYAPGADLTMAGCNDPSIGASLDTATIPAASGSVTITEGTLVASAAAPAFPTEPSPLPAPVRTALTPRSFCQ